LKSGAALTFYLTFGPRRVTIAAPTIAAILSGVPRPDQAHTIVAQSSRDFHATLIKLSHGGARNAALRRKRSGA
jgi:hypothetical protein